MSSNEITITNKADLAYFYESEKLYNEPQVVRYSLVDASRYSFEYVIDSDTKVFMYESDRVFDSSDIEDVEFDDKVSEDHRSYYLVAATSGIITGIFSSLKLSEKVLDKINEWKSKDWDGYISALAGMVGYGNDDAAGAIKFLRDRIVTAVASGLEREQNETMDRWSSIVSNHPSIVGLVYSVLTQFSGKRYVFEDDKIKSEPLPEYYSLGRNTAEKIICGALYWFFDMAMNATVSAKSLLNDIKVPKELQKLLRELSKLPIFRNIATKIENAERYFSEWISNIFKSHSYKDENGDLKEYDFYGSITESILLKGCLKSIPVLMNECIVRLYYLLKKLITELKNKKITNIEDFSKIDIQKIIPFNNRLLSRMLLISSGCFVGVNVAGATIKAIKEESKREGSFAKTLFTEISFEGIGRFIFACVADSKYWIEDIQILFQRMVRARRFEESPEDEEKIASEMMHSNAFQALSLTPTQTRALYSLENIAVLNDIERTESEEEKEKKQLWVDAWHDRIISGMAANSRGYFITDEKKIYDSFYALEQNEDNLRWFYLMTMELVVFKPYYPLGTNEDGEFQKLRRGKFNYIDEVFVVKQTIVSQAEVDKFREFYKEYKDLVGVRKNSSFFPNGIVAAALFVAGGLPFLVGGALLKMTGILSQTDSEYWLRQGSKLLVFSKCILKDKLDDTESIKSLHDEIGITIQKLEDNRIELENEKCSLDDASIKNAKVSIEYLEKCEKEIEKLM